MAEAEVESSAYVNKNKMGLLGAISYIIGNIVGSGIFIAPTAILLKTDTVGLSLSVWAAAAIISILGSFCYVELGTSIRISGADFAYLCYVKWYSVAFAFMCAGCAINYPATIAIQAETFAEYVIKGFELELADSLASYLAKKLIGFSLLWLLMFLNFFSLKTFVSRFQIVATFAKVLSTAIVIFTGFYYLIFRGWTQNLKNPFDGTNFDAGNVALALYAGLFSYDGWDILNFGAEEIEKPRRTMPLAIIIGMTVVAIIYIATNISYFVVLSVDEIKASQAVASTFAAATLGNFQYAMPFLICVLLVGSLNSTLFSASRWTTVTCSLFFRNILDYYNIVKALQSRRLREKKLALQAKAALSLHMYLHAAARQGHLPSFISCANDINDSPRAAVFVNIILSMGLSFAGDLDTLISYVGFAQWSQRSLTMLALLWIRFRHKPVHADAIRTPIIMPVVFFVICTALVLVTIVKDIALSGVGLGVIAAGFIIYFLFLYERSLPSTKCFQRASFAINNATTAFAQIVFNTMPTRVAEEEELIHSTPAATNSSTEDMFTLSVTKDEKRQKHGRIKRLFRHRKANIADVNKPPPNCADAFNEIDKK
uniref:Amino acid permease/ SLC12A domain-containing protein n=1 Tax=Ascaris lumbricoides TaxID=6252 RepID=A0A9J2PEL9_ASCLU